MATLATAIQRGTRGAQPAATAVSIGTLYSVTDEGDKVERSNGATWDQYAPSAGGTVTNTGTLTSGKTIVGNGSADVTVSALTAQFVGSSSGTAAAASMTTNRLLGRTTASSGAVEEITPGASLKFAAGALNGRVVQIVKAQTGAVATGTTQIPRDDSIPQNTEGDEYMTLAITPTDSGNNLLVRVTIFLSINQNGRTMNAALFRDSGADAVAAGTGRVEVSTAITEIVFESPLIAAGSTSSTTFKVRAGASDTGTTTFNGASGARIFGGVMASSITITEITV